MHAATVHYYSLTPVKYAFVYATLVHGSTDSHPTSTEKRKTLYMCAAYYG